MKKNENGMDTCHTHHCRYFQQFEGVWECLACLVAERNSLKLQVRAGCALAERVIDCYSEVPHSVQKLAEEFQAIEKRQLEKRVEGGQKCCCDLVKAGHGGYCQLHG